MRFVESDLDFNRLSGVQFEELCYDLLVNVGFTNVGWRRGGGDSGRDLEATLIWRHPIVGDVPELWFFECKRHSTGIDVTDVSSKIDWAKAMHPQRLVFLISSYLTNQCLQYLETIRPQMATALSVVDGKTLKRLLLRYPLLVEKYFLSEHQKVMQNAVVDFLWHNWYISLDRVASLARQVDLPKFDLPELVLLLISYYANNELLDAYVNEMGNDPIDLKPVVQRIVSIVQWHPQSLLEEIQPVEVITTGWGYSDSSTLICWGRGTFQCQAGTVDGDYLRISAGPTDGHLELLLGRLGTGNRLFIETRKLGRLPSDVDRPLWEAWREHKHKKDDGPEP